MKVKTILITAAVVGAMTAGGIFGARYYIRHNRKPVNVVPVANVNMTYWGDEETTISGTVVSEDSQNVELSPDYALTKVYVKTGDSVKRGDALLEYDMTMVQLQREMEDLGHQTLELTLQNQQNELEKLMKNPGAASISAELDKEKEENKSKSADVVDPAEFDVTDVLDDSGEGEGGGEPSVFEEEQPAGSQEEVGGDLISDPSGDDPGTDPGGALDDLPDAFEVQGEDGEPDDLEQDPAEQDPYEPFREAGLSEDQIAFMQKLVAVFAGTSQAGDLDLTVLLSQMGNEDIANALIAYFELPEDFYDYLIAALAGQKEVQDTDLHDKLLETNLSEEDIAFVENLIAVFTGDPDSGTLDLTTLFNRMSRDDITAALITYFALPEELSEVLRAVLDGETEQENLHDKLVEAGLSEEDIAYIENLVAFLKGDPESEKPDLTVLFGKMSQEEVVSFVLKMVLGDTTNDEKTDEESWQRYFNEKELAAFRQFQQDREGFELTEDDLMRVMNILSFQHYCEELKSAYSLGEDQLSLASIEYAMNLFQNDLAAAPSAEKETLRSFTDVYGNDRSIAAYLLSEEVLSTITKMENRSALRDVPYSADEQIASLYKGYLRLSYYNLFYQMEQMKKTLENAGLTVDMVTPDQARTMQSMIAGALDAYYRLAEVIGTSEKVLSSYYTEEELTQYLSNYKAYLTACAGQDLKLEDPSDGDLSRLIARLREVVPNPEPEIIVETEAATESVTEEWTEKLTEAPYVDLGGYDGGEAPEETLSREELTSMIREARYEIEETKLQIRESDLKLKQFDRKLSEKVVRASMDGIVKSAGMMDEGTLSEDFIVITGEKGMYVKGTVNELSRDTVRIGDVLTGTSYENGASFTATVTEISTYPEQGNDFYYGFGSENTNASYYPFTAYIEDADEIVEGSVEMMFENSQSSSGIYLENYYIRTDESGKNYVYLQGEDGLLKKQYVKVGKSLWGYYLEITSGVTLQDKIAFPYGKNVSEGAPTNEVENLEESAFYG